MKLQRIITHTVLTVICLLLIVPTLCYMFPFLAGADSSYKVTGGSMFPALKSGDLILNKKVDPSTIDVGDILTVKPGDHVYTHRVVEKVEGEILRFRLKGDANEDPDPNYVRASQIIGKVVLVFPFSFLSTPIGFILSLIVPAALIIGKQMHLIYTRKKKEESESSQIVDTSTLLLTIIFIFSLIRIIMPYFLGSSTYFSDVESVSGIFQTGIWHIDATVDIDPDTLNLDSQGQWIAVYAYIVTEYDENDIDVSTVKIDGIVQAEWGEVQDDSHLMVKFDRTAVIEHLIALDCGDGDEVTLIVSGSFMAGTQFSGEDTIKVVDNS